MPCEPHYRMHDYHDSGAALVSTSLLPIPGASRQVERPPPPRIFPRLSCRYRRRIAETVNQRQGRVRGRGIGAACSSPPLRREHDAAVNWKRGRFSRVQVLLVKSMLAYEKDSDELIITTIAARICTGKRFNEHSPNYSTVSQSFDRSYIFF